MDNEAYCIRSTDVSRLDLKTCVIWMWLANSFSVQQLYQPAAGNFGSVLFFCPHASLTRDEKYNYCQNTDCTL